MGHRIVVIVVVMGMLSACKKHNEHAGSAVSSSGEHAGKEHAGKDASKEHAGKEHAGKEAGKEHAGKEHAGKEHAGKEHAGSATKVSAQNIKDAMNAHITAETAKGGGVFKIKDEKTSENLELNFVKIHDPVRKIDGKGYFACTDFSVKGAPEKLYDLDFWLNPGTDGKLAVTATKIHKHPKQTGGKWEKEARYTFENDKPVEIQ